MFKITILPTSQYSKLFFFLTISSRFVVKNQNLNFPVFRRSNYEVTTAKRRGDSPNDAVIELGNSGKKVALAILTSLRRTGFCALRPLRLK